METHTQICNSQLGSLGNFQAISESFEPLRPKLTKDVLQGSQFIAPTAMPTLDSEYSAKQHSPSLPPEVENLQLNGKKSPLWSPTDSFSKEFTRRASPHTTLASPGLDPLSNQIFWRTQSERNSKSRISAAENGAQLNGQSSDLPSEMSPNIHKADAMYLKERKKGASFLSRFNIKSGKKKEVNRELDKDADEQEIGDPRTEGMNAHVFSSSIGANGFTPQYKKPPSYIKVRTRNKKQREFNHMFLAQELISDDKIGDETPTESKGAIWTMEFSLDGRYLAAAGRDKIIRVWAVLSTPEEREAHEHEEDVKSGTSGGERLSAPVFKSKPIWEYQGHTGDVLDLNWSKNNFLLSSSMDKSVKLWHPSRQECLCTFNHIDFVTSIAFHPTDDRFFLAGSLDSTLRLWSIPEKKVAYSCEFPDIITAVAFTPNGMIVIAGGLSGLCQFYDIDQNHGFKMNSQVHVRSSRGRNAKGSKITGIRTMNSLPSFPETGDAYILVTSNDSRIRLYSFKDKRLEMKFQGHENTCSQINASFSDDGRYVICGSENRKAYIWNTCPRDSESKEKPPMEMFNAHSHMVTTAIIAPAATRRLLSESGDPIYDTCNPPPVTLLSLEESNIDSEKRASDAFSSKKFEEYPAYLARISHDDGPIIVTSDYAGSVKCFRLDCAHEKRHQWDASSTFSKNRSSLRRANSIITRHSNSSRHNSLSRSQSSFNIFASANFHNEQILSWRSDIKDDVNRSYNDRSVSFENSVRGSFQSSSPSESQHRLDGAIENSPYAALSIASNPSALVLPPTTGFSFHPTDLSDEVPTRTDSSAKMNSFWNISNWRTFGSVNPSRVYEDQNGARRLSRDRNEHLGTKLSRELSGVKEEIHEHSSDFEGEQLHCTMCGGEDFRARKVTGKGLVMVCVSCGTVIG